MATTSWSWAYPKGPSWKMSSGFVDICGYLCGFNRFSLLSSGSIWIEIEITYYLTIYTRPVNLHPLFLFWKHGLVCDLEKNQVQNMGCEKQSAKTRVFFFQKGKRPGCHFSFLITMTLVFAPCFLHPIFWTWFFFKFQTLKNVRSTW